MRGGCGATKTGQRMPRPHGLQRAHTRASPGARPMRPARGPTDASARSVRVQSASLRKRGVPSASVSSNIASGRTQRLRSLGHSCS
ncbi:hypothetical protein DO72_3851 [Burkholderia pseudomallei]|nr:hypothetical protein DO72_3851 [Burkholderia pseudomallei]